MVMESVLIARASWSGGRCDDGGAVADGGVALAGVAVLAGGAAIDEVAIRTAATMFVGRKSTPQIIRETRQCHRNVVL